jgi:hypothetical protein
MYLPKIRSRSVPSRCSFNQYSIVRFGSSESLNRVNAIISRAVSESSATFSYEGIPEFGTASCDFDHSLGGRSKALKTCIHLLNFKAGGKVEFVREVAESQQFDFFTNQLKKIRQFFKHKSSMTHEMSSLETKKVLEKITPKHQEFEHIGLQLHDLRKESLSQQLILDELLLSFEESHPLIICQKKIMQELGLEISTLQILWGKIYQENFLELRKLMEITQPSSPVACTVLEEHFTVLGITFGDILESLMTFLPLLGYIMILCRINSAIMIEAERPFQMHDHDDFDFFFK